MFSSLSTRRQHALSSAVATLLLGSALFTAASEIRAQSSDSQQTSQDAAEAARQERARKEQNSNPSEHHVYTNEDLRRGRILTPEDQSRAAAARQKQGPHLNAQPDAQPLDANSGKRQEPLGDVARRYRNLKRESIHPSPFHLPTNQPELAAPKMLELVPAPAFKANGQPQPPARDFGLMNPSAPAGRIPSASAPTFPTAPMRRVDPFSRRHVRPLPPVMDVRPNMPHSPAQPNFSSPNIATTPTVRPNFSAPVHTAPVATPNIIVVQQGDTLWTLSRQHLGRGTRWLELMAANPNLPDPTRLAPGTTLVLPSHMTSRQAKSIPHSVTVQAGDTLSQIALATYGHASAWTCIAQANPTLSNPHVLAIGQSLVLPASCSAN
jgi:nucleoid-associated protein YgaU